MDFYDLLWPFLWAVIKGLIWGFATAAIRNKRGYGRRWFWFGFFLGLIPFIIACCIPAKPVDPSEERDRLLANQKARDYLARSTVAGGGWQCSCGRVNAAYVSTCTCGLGKRQNDTSGSLTAKTEQQVLDTELKKYAMMLDSQVISQAEYDAKVKELMHN